MIGRSDWTFTDSVLKYSEIKQHLEKHIHDKDALEKALDAIVAYGGLCRKETKELCGPSAKYYWL